MKLKSQPVTEVQTQFLTAEIQTAGTMLKAAETEFGERHWDDVRRILGKARKAIAAVRRFTPQVDTEPGQWMEKTRELESKIDEMETAVRGAMAEGR